jgi:hypothetical protein
MAQMKDALTVFLHAPTLFITALHAFERSRNDTSPLHTDALVIIVFAAASLEAFINEIASSAAAVVRAKHQPNEKMKAFVDLLAELEDSRASVKSKYIMTRWILSGTAIDKGSATFQDFAALLELRNELVHMKGMSESHAREELPEFRQPKAVNHLKGKKLLSQRAGDERRSWTERIRTRECALWACRTAAAMVVEIMDSFPADHPFWSSMRRVYDEPFLEFLKHPPHL